MKLSYIKVGNYLLPNVVVNEQKGVINKYGYLRLHYLKEYKKGLYTTLLMQDNLTNHLVSVSNEAENKVNFLIESYKRKYKLTKKKKENNQLEWVQLMNNYKNMAEEIVLNELIYN
ncbi:MAG: TnpV protein [Bacilli bacterium]|nr:TnpV protein [Bacilli bacterium]